MAIAELGGRCVVCGESELGVLQIDHIIPVRRPSAKHSTTWNTVSQILRGEKENLQLLCANCHQRKSWPQIANVSAWLISPTGRLATESHELRRRRRARRSKDTPR